MPAYRGKLHRQGALVLVRVTALPHADLASVLYDKGMLAIKRPVSHPPAPIGFGPDTIAEPVKTYRTPKAYG